ncbi:hypothetical protein Dimus_035978 [Dionaea muscipula]
MGGEGLVAAARFGLVVDWHGGDGGDGAPTTSPSWLLWVAVVSKGWTAAARSGQRGIDGGDGFVVVGEGRTTTNLAYRWRFSASRPAGRPNEGGAPPVARSMLAWWRGGSVVVLLLHRLRDLGSLLVAGGWRWPIWSSWQNVLMASRMKEMTSLCVMIPI